MSRRGNFVRGRIGARRLAAAVFAPMTAMTAMLAGCGESAPPAPDPPAALVHLADQLGAAAIACGPAPARASRTWTFDVPRPEWSALPPGGPTGLAAVALEPQPDALRLRLVQAAAGGPPVGGVTVDVDDTPISDWSEVVVRARTHERLSGVGVSYNVAEAGGVLGRFSFMMGGTGTSPVFGDGSTQDYELRLSPREASGTLRDLALFVAAPGPGSLDVLSVSLVPRGAEYTGDHGVRTVTRGGTTRTAIYAHAPARLAWRLTVPPGGRLDTGLSCLRGESLHYRVTAAIAGGAGAAGAASGGSPAVLVEQDADDGEAWRQVSVDLGAFAGQSIELALEADGPPGSVALWGAPVVSGSGSRRGPNVIFYVIDGGGADQMSVYRYGRPTTPFLEELAKEGVLCEHAYSNATWTQPSTASFMTSLQHSVLGGLRRGLHSTPVPAGATTMAESMRRGGWQTAVFTSNPNAARVIGLQRGVDVMRDVAGGNHAASSIALHDLFRGWRADYPGGPWWVHFQTTDVHEPNEPEPPFAGMFAPPDIQAQVEAWDEQLHEAVPGLFGTTSIAGFYDTALERSGVDRQAYFGGRRDLYDETVASQDSQLRAFTGWLKESGQWNDTLLVIAADHGHPAGTFARWGRGLFVPQPEPWQGALFDSYATRVPLIFVWPGHLPAGRHVTAPVSMIDVLPTILDLCGLPAPQVAQGRTLAPLLRGETEEHPPVILDEFRVDEATGEMIGNLDVVDGRWGASLEIGPGPASAATASPAFGRHAVPAGGRWGAVHPYFPDVPRLLLYDLAADPFARRAVNDEHPDLVASYEARLRQQWTAHRALASQFREGSAEALSKEQLDDLKALGYVR